MACQGRIRYGENLLTSRLILDVEQRAFIDSGADCAHRAGVEEVYEPLVVEGGNVKTRLLPYAVKLLLYSWRCRL